jgi:hypothetical protein
MGLRKPWPAEISALSGVSMKVCARFSWQGRSIMREPVVTSLAAPALLCKMVNTSNADPPRLHKRWTLRSEIHYVAVLLPPGRRASAAT